jgi:hypothetical protein
MINMVCIAADGSSKAGNTDTKSVNCKSIFAPRYKLILIQRCRVVASSDFVTLIVGPEKERLSCHKILLRYASERLDALVSKDCPSSTRQEIELPDELFEPMTAWIAWIYTGHVPPTCKLTPEALFIFGERLKSPAFRNELMLCLISRYSRMGHKEEFFEDITPKMADYVYQNTVKDSKLRRFVVDWILEVCPLTEDGDNGLHFMRTEKEKEEMRREWRQLIKRNGDLVSEVALRGSWFENSWNQDSVARGFAMDTIEYFEPDRPIEDFLEG